MASPPAEEDNPCQSSAALCISLTLLEKSFGPEFTHQCFPGEVIPGYRPKNFANLTGKQHSSHVHHEVATQELQIGIKLSPSCRKCMVEIQVDEGESDAGRAAKRPRLEKTSNVVNTAAATNDNAEDATPIKSEKRVTFQEPEETAAEAEASPMSLDEIQAFLSKALPTIVSSDTAAADDYLTAPIGRVMKEFQRNDMNFVISIASGPDAVDYHNQVQKLALWFIENADCVDLASSEGGGYWKVLYLFRKHAPTKYSLVGYITLFHFHAPFKKPKSGTVARVCQVLILPPYQRMGLGKALLKQVYDMARNDDNDIVEINVEDPAPACTLLRNRLDYDMLKESFASDSPWLDSTNYSATDVSSPDFFKPLSDADAIPAGAVACITPRQVQIAYELYKLSLLPEQDCPEDLLKKYRLFVKKRLVRVHREELGGCASKEEKQALLAKIFDETLEQYNMILKRGR